MPSIAWPTIVLLALLLPGFFFFFGLTIPQRYTRETVPRSPFGQLAATLAVSIVVHAALFGLAAWQPWIPDVDFKTVLSTVQASSGAVDVSGLAKNMSANLYWILLYLSAACILGGLSGWGCSRCAWFHEYRWVTELAPKPDDEISTYVVTKLEHEGRVVLYQGFLGRFGVRQDGTLAYLFLVEVYDRFLDLCGDSPKATNRSDKQIGQGGVSHKSLYISGDEISNVYFSAARIDALDEVPPAEQNTQEDPKAPKHDPNQLPGAKLGDVEH